MEPKELLELYKWSVERGDKRSKLDGIVMSGKEIVGYDLRCVDWGDSDFSETVFDGCDLRGSDFSKAKMSGAKLIRCRIFDCKFPAESIQFIECVRDLFSSKNI